eukprot:sb/3474662/
MARMDVDYGLDQEDAETDVVPGSLTNLEKGSEEKGKDPIDLHYRKLNSDIAVLNRTSQEFALLQRYVDTTHAATHSNYTLEIENIFTVTREGEEARYKEYSTLPLYYFNPTPPTGRGGTLQRVQYPSQQDVIVAR